MLRVFRDNLKYLKWVLWLVVLVFVGFVFVDFGSIDLGARASTTTPAAVVGDDEVSYREFEQAYRQLESRYRESFGDQFSRDLANQLGLPMQALNGLVNERIILREAKQMGLAVTDDELRRAILELPVLKDSSGAFIGQAAYSDLLRRNNLTPEDFEAAQRQGMLIEKVQAALSQTVFVAPEEIEADYRREAETATISLLRLPAARFASEVTVEDDALASFFDERKNDFHLPERRVVDYLLVEPAALQASVEIDDAAVRTYYEGHPADFTGEEQVKARHILLRTGADRTPDAARAELERIKARIEAGEDFATLASELSEDPGSKVKGGDLGFFARGAMVKPFEDAAFGAELGDLVGPVESNFGAHLIQVQARRPGGLQPLEEVSAAITARLAGEAAAEAAHTQAEALAARIAEEVPDTAALQALADSEEGTSATTTAAFGRDDNIAGIGRATAFTTEAFELTVGAVSQPVQVPRGWAILVLREVQEPRLPELDEVRTQVTAEYRSQRQLELAEARAREAHSKLVAGGSLEEIAGELGLSVETAGPFNASGQVGGLGQAPEVSRLALTLDAGAIGEPVVRDADVVLFSVTERTRFDSDEFAARRDEVRRRLEGERTSELLASLVTKRRDELGVTFDPQIFEVFAQNQQGVS